MNLSTEKVYSVGYMRVSDPSQIHGTSEENQDIILRKKASDLGAPLWPDGKIFTEAHTGSVSSRPVYDHLFQKVKEARQQGINIKYFIIYVIDRFTRGGAVSYAVMKNELFDLGVELVDAFGMIQPMQNSLGHLGLQFGWSMFSPSEPAEVMAAVYAKIEKRKILDRMIGGEVLLSRKGYRVRFPLDGYINKKVIYDASQGKRATIQAPDPERAKYYKSLYEYFDTPTIPLKEAVAKVNLMGFKTKIKRRWNKEKTKIIGQFGGKPLTLKQAQKAVANPGYAGIAIENWTGAKPMKAPYPGLVSVDQFNRVNARVNKGRVFIKEKSDGTIEILNNSMSGKRVYLKNDLKYPFRHVVLCPLCKPLHPMKGSAPRGKSGKRYPTLHCNRNHKYIGIPRDTFVQTVEDFIDKLTFTHEFIDALEATLIRKYHQRKEEAEKIQENATNRIAELEAELENAVLSFEKATTNTLRERLEKRVVDLEHQIHSLKNNVPDIEISLAQIHEFILFARKIVEHPKHSGKILINTEDLEKQKAYFKLAFKELPTYAEIQSGTPKLSEIFKLRKAFDESGSLESLWVSLEGCGWNTLTREILKFSSF